MGVENHAQEWREVHARDKRDTKGEGKLLRARKASERKRHTQEERTFITGSMKERKLTRKKESM